MNPKGEPLELRSRCLRLAKSKTSITSIAGLNRKNKQSVEDIEQYIKNEEYEKALIELKFILDNGSEFEASVRERYVKLKSLMLVDDKKNYEFHKAEVRELRKVLGSGGGEK